MNKLPSISEHQLQTLIMNYLTANGYYVQRMNSGAIRDSKGYMIRFGQAGTPDIMAFKPNKLNAAAADLIFIEVKTPRNPTPTLLQARKMDELEEHGATCLVVHSLEELQEQLIIYPTV